MLPERRERRGWWWMEARKGMRVKGMGRPGEIRWKESNQRVGKEGREESVKKKKKRKK